MTEQKTDQELIFEYTAMVSELAKPGNDIIAALTPRTAHILHMAVGISGEVAELIEAVRDGADNILEELGDIEFYFEGLLLHMGVNFELSPEYSDRMYDDYNIRPLLEEMAIVAGGILDKAKRVAIYNKPMESQRLQLLHLIKDLRSLLTCAYRHSEINASWRMARGLNMAKLLKGDNARYKSGRYSNEQANARADKN